MPPVRPRRDTSRSRQQDEHLDGSDDDEEDLHDDAAVPVAQGGSREAARPSGRRAGSRSAAEARAPARKEHPKHTGARHPPVCADNDDEAAEGADDDGEEVVTDEDDEDDSDGAFEDYYDDEVKPSDYKNGDLVLPQGPYGNRTYQITFAAKKRGNVKMVLAPLAQQILPPTSAEGYESDLDEYQIAPAWAQVARGYAIAKMKKTKKDTTGAKKKPSASVPMNELQFLLATAQNPTGLDANATMPANAYHVAHFTDGTLNPYFDESDESVGPSAFNSPRLWKKNLLEHIFSAMVCQNACLLPKLAGGIGVAQTTPGSMKRKFFGVETPGLLKTLVIDNHAPLVIILQAFADRTIASSTYQYTDDFREYIDDIDMPDVPLEFVRTRGATTLAGGMQPEPSRSVKQMGASQGRPQALDDMKDDPLFRTLSTRAVLKIRLCPKPVQEILYGCEQRAAGDVPNKDPGVMEATYNNLLFAICRHLDGGQRCARLYPPFTKTNAMTPCWEEPPMYDGKEVWEPGAVPAHQTFRRLFGAYLKRLEGRTGGSSRSDLSRFDNDERRGGGNNLRRDDERGRCADKDERRRGDDRDDRDGGGHRRHTDEDECRDDRRHGGGNHSSFSWQAALSTGGGSDEGSGYGQEHPHHSWGSGTPYSPWAEGDENHVYGYDPDTQWRRGTDGAAPPVDPPPVRSPLSNRPSPKQSHAAILPLKKRRYN